MRGWRTTAASGGIWLSCDWSIALRGDTRGLTVPDDAICVDIQGQVALGSAISPLRDPPVTSRRDTVGSPAIGVAISSVCNRRDHSRVEGSENRSGDVAAVVVNGCDGRGLVNEAGKSPVPERLMPAQAFPAVANDATSAVIQSVSVL